MVTEVSVPQLGESIAEVILLEWLKDDGERVEVDEAICVLETDKANVELPAPAAGVLKRRTQVGDTVNVGDAIAEIDPDGIPTRAESKLAATAAEPSDVGQVTAALSPAVRRLLDENELSPDAIEGSGKGGRITKEDVLRHLDSLKKIDVPEPEAEQPPPPRPTPPAAPSLVRAPAPDMDFDETGIRRVPMTKIRRTIAARLVKVQNTAAMLTTFNEVDMSGIMDLRKQYKERFSEVHGVPLGLMPFFCRACVMALSEFPSVNASIDEDAIVYHQYVHMGIAVSTEHGLVVPVLRNMESMSFAQIEAAIRRTAESVRVGQLGIQELSGGTFTITNGGVFGSMLSTPILNAPQSAILGMHTIQKRPVAVGDQVEIRPMMYLALTYDHRLIDGRESVAFLVRVKALLEDPVRLLLEV